MTNLHILAGAIPATKMVNTLLPAQTELKYQNVSVYGSPEITNITEIIDADQARACSVKLMDLKTFKFYFVPLGTLLSLSTGSDNVYSAISKANQFIDIVTITGQKPVKNGKVELYAYKDYIAYPALLKKADKALIEALKAKPNDENLSSMMDVNYLFSGKFTSELRELRKSGAQTVIVAGATPLQEFEVTVTTKA